MKIKEGRKRKYIGEHDKACVHDWVDTGIFMEDSPIFQCKKCYSLMVKLASVETENLFDED